MNYMTVSQVFARNTSSYSLAEIQYRSNCSAAGGRGRVPLTLPPACYAWVVRLFTGIALPPEVAGRISRLLDYLRPAAHLRWCPAYNLHITTRFIGEWPESRLPELSGALAPLGARPPVPIRVEGIGWMPNPHAPRVLFVGVRPEGGLAELAADTERATETIGIAPEPRVYRPHLTLARIKDTAIPLAPIRQAIARLESTEFGSFEAPGFSLYRSETGPAGPVYTQLAEIRFTG